MMERGGNWSFSVVFFSKYKTEKLKNFKALIGDEESCFSNPTSDLFKSLINWVLNSDKNFNKKKLKKKYFFLYIVTIVHPPWFYKFYQKYFFIFLKNLIQKLLNRYRVISTR